MQYLKYMFMRLNLQTDYALRILMTLAASPEQIFSVETVAKTQNISRNHLAKVAQDLARLGYVNTVRGRNGGLKLAKPSNSIYVGQVVRAIEQELGLVECLQSDCKSHCTFLPGCRLKSLMQTATAAFWNKLDSVNIAQLIG